MADFDYDLFVIGGGSGGVRAARMSAGHGARVAITEEHRYGGTCVIRGCVPKKLMVYASHFRETFEDAAGYGWEVGERRFDWHAFKARKDAEIDRLENAYVTNLGKAGVEVLRGRAALAGPHEIRLEDGREVSARHILIATGGWPFVPDIPGSEHVAVSNDIFELPEQPRRVLIVGGGYIACEFAGIFAGLGSEVVQLYRRDLILRGFDDDLRTHITKECRKKGIDLRTEEDVAAVERKGEGYLARLEGGGTIETDLVFYATGRNPNTSGLGLEEAGIELGRGGEVPVDDWSQTKVPSIYGVGDVTDRLALTPVAIREGHAFADTVFGAESTKADHALVPTAVFTQPEIGTVGLTEAQAREECEVDIYRTEFRGMMHAFPDRDERMLYKLVVARESRRVLGVHIVGHAAGELIQALGIAVKMGATKEDFDRTVAVHPTAAEELVTMREPVG